MLAVERRRGRTLREAEFAAFVDVRRAAYVRTAYLFCGDWHRAEDLVQVALVKLYGAWPRLTRTGGEDAYVRRILVNAHIDDWRHRSRRPEAPLAEHHDYARATGSATEDRDALLRALARLPEGQRKVIVLRFFLDLSVQDTASDLGVTTGTVKSQSVRGLARLRELLGDELVPSPPDIKEDAR